MTRLRRLATRVLFQIGRTAHRISRLFTYLAASTLRLAEMKDEIRQRWQGADDREADIAAGLMPWEEDLFERFVQPGADVLLIGCGSGRDLLPLVERGCHVTGVDPARSALRIAQRLVSERGLSATFVEGFVEDASLSGSFDVVVFSYYCYTLIPESNRRIGALHKSAAVLKPGGHILISYPLQARPRSILIKLAGSMGVVCGSDWRLEDGDELYLAGGKRLFYAHSFEPGEIQKEGAAAGLRPVFQREFPHDPVVAFVRA